MPPPQIKPENVLKRADELIALDQKQSALTLLHDLILSKRGRNTPIASLEPIVLRFVELCVDLRKGKTAKEGLFQYKNIAQNTSVTTIETVLKHYLDLATERVADAQSKSQQLVLDSISDLDAASTPESVMMSSVSAANSQDRTDRAILTPWLAFLWEGYRTTLDILRNNARLEIMYQSVANAAFQFCLTYQRKSEFKRLCDLLRNHLQIASRSPSAKSTGTAAHLINLSEPETLQRHIDTRFSQLSASVELELWNEAFRSIEDIHHLLSLSKRPPKPATMALYYERMVRIFAVSQNHLFHAAAWARLAGIRSIPRSPAEEQRLANNAILSTLSIPVISTSRVRWGNFDAEQTRAKEARLSALLGLQNAPTRRSLLAQALTRGLLAKASPEVVAIYKNLEEEFHPLSICGKIQPYLHKIAEDERQAQYVKNLQQVILTRMFQQLSQVYETVSLDFVLGLAKFDEPFSISALDVDRFIMKGSREGDLNVRVDHAARALTFSNDVLAKEKEQLDDDDKDLLRLQETPSEMIRTRLTKISRALFSVVSIVDRGFRDDINSCRDAARASAIESVAAEHKEALLRRSIIDRRKELVEQQQIRKERERLTKEAAQKQADQEAETKRIQEEARRREIERLRREQNAIRQEETRKLVEDLRAKGSRIEIDNLEELDTAKLRVMHIQQLEKESRDMNERMRITAKRLDHIERAYRREEIPLLEQDYLEQQKRDRAAFEEARKARIENGKIRHAEAVALKQRLDRIVPDYNSYCERVNSKRHAAYEAKVARAKQALEEAKEARREEVRQRRIEEIRAAREAEAKREREEAARAQAEREEEERKAARRQELEERRRQQEEERARLDETARLQRQREQEAEQRREERRRAALANTSPAASNAAPARSGYVPPHLRRQQQQPPQQQSGAQEPVPSPAPAVDAAKDTPPPAAQQPQKYVRGAFRRMREQQQ